MEIFFAAVILGVIWWIVKSDDSPDVPLTPPELPEWPPKNDTFRA